MVFKTNKVYNKKNKKYEEKIIESKEVLAITIILGLIGILSRSSLASTTYQLTIVKKQADIQYLEEKRGYLENSITSIEETTGKVKIVKDIKNSIEGKDVLIIEDIIDTGTTLSFLKEYLKLKRPNSLKIATLLSKPSRRTKELEVEYIGFGIEDKFVVGYGLDYNQNYRNLPYIGYVESADEF